jgi:hypothetical protein
MASGARITAAATVRWVTFRRSANARILSRSALPNTIRARVANAYAILWLRNHASNWARSASLIATTHLFTPMQHRRIAPYTLFSDATLVSLIFVNTRPILQDAAETTGHQRYYSVE